MDNFNKTFLGVLAVSLFSLTALQTGVGLFDQTSRILGEQSIGKSEPVVSTATCKTGIKSFSISTPCEDGRYRYSIFQCHDKTTYTEGGSTSCKSSADWESYARAKCSGKSSCSGPTPTLKPSPTSPYYVKASGWINADPNAAVAAPFGCNPGDIALSGGMEFYTGTINTWRTIKSSPESLGESNTWTTTVINEGSTPQQFTVVVKCLRGKI